MQTDVMNENIPSNTLLHCFVQGLDVSPELRKLLDITTTELIGERDLAQSIVQDKQGSL